MIGGQAADLEAEKEAAPTAELVSKIHENKTGKLMRASLSVGAILAGAVRGDALARRPLRPEDRPGLSDQGRPARRRVRRGDPRQGLAQGRGRGQGDLPGHLGRRNARGSSSRRTSRRRSRRLRRCPAAAACSRIWRASSGRASRESRRLLAILLPVAACVTTTPTPTPTSTPTPDPNCRRRRRRSRRRGRAAAATEADAGTEPAPPATPRRRRIVANPGTASSPPASPSSSPSVRPPGSGERACRIRFASVEEDSRCPEGAQCIVAREGPDPPERLGRRRTARRRRARARGGDPRTPRVGDQTIRLLDLTPYPSTKRRIEPADYRARLVVGNL